MNNAKSIPSGALKAIINYGEVLEKLDKTNISYNKEFNKKSIRDTHRAFSNFFGEESRCIDEGTFDMLCDAPFSSFFGQDLYPDVYTKAAKIMEGFATHQVFSNGNKRLAVGAMMQYLESKKIKFQLNQNAVYKFVMDVANHKIGSSKEVMVDGNYIPENIVKIASIIKNNSVELEVSKESMNYIPVGSAKRFNKKEYENVRNNESGYSSKEMFEYMSSR